LQKRFTRTFAEQSHQKDCSDSKLKGLQSYFRRNPGTLFIVAFQVLLISAALLFVFGNSPAANLITIYAFSALVIGVLIQMSLVIRESKQDIATSSVESSSSS
jgi:hypothetical protein